MVTGIETDGDNKINLQGSPCAEGCIAFLRVEVRTDMGA